ncbi:type VII secretion protein EccB [Kibdelosporangium banguiense]|uniref:Type VII secretion protein EccB n=1 Tax=Kibdelosporangium banguiense TaxID=1365924 RepID=A0ABS4TDK6_9PSEU|nr:type VII secretion protein EccB [Kibdelosporangium banguiense]MBP2322501.1 type VII secretion protein EccB [Kibdelosporangium banguiense]
MVVLRAGQAGAHRAAVPPVVVLADVLPAVAYQGVQAWSPTFLFRLFPSITLLVSSYPEPRAGRLRYGYPAEPYRDWESCRPRMPSTPTTKSQVQAYRFVLRRMQSALVRKDAVMLHDPMRTHSRATIVGVCLAAIGVLGFVIVGLLSPKPTVPDSGIIIAEPSGTVYVVSGNPKTLTPTFNLASARLLVLAQSNQGQGDDSGASADVDTPAAAPPDPTVIADKDLKDIPKRQLTGIPNGPQLLPADDQRIKDFWAVCDKILIDPTRPDATNKIGIETSVVAGVENMDRELRDGESLLVRARNNKVYLIYRTPTDANQPTANAVRAEVDISKASVVGALRLNTRAIRDISTGLLNAIPEVSALRAPQIGGGSTTVNLGLPLGSVFAVPLAGDVRKYYVIQRDRIEEIKQTTADLIRYERSPGGATIPDISPDRINSIQQTKSEADKSSPSTVPQVLEAQPGGNSVACLRWTMQGSGEGRDQHTSLHISGDVPTMNDQQGAKMQPLKIATPNADGQKIDNFFMPPGLAAVARGSSSKQDFDRGPIYLISDRGVKYGIPDTRTAGALGLAKQSPAPLAIVRLLPDGALLLEKDANRSYDSVPFDPRAGTVNTPSASAGAQPGGS